MPVPEAAGRVRIAFLPPMSGLAATETRLDHGAVNVRLGEGRTAEVLRNLCHGIHEKGTRWADLVGRIQDLFGAELRPPRYIAERGEIAMSQIIAASHSEVLLNEAAGRDLVIAFVGKPHRLDNRGSQVLKSLNEIGFEHYYQAEQTGWVLYLEGSTDLSMLRAFAARLDHGPALRALERPFVHYVGNQPMAAVNHFQALREALPELRGVGLFDRLGREPPDSGSIEWLMWERREFENYLTTRRTLERYAAASGREATPGPLFAESEQTTAVSAMRCSIEGIEAALKTLGKGSPWNPDIEASDDFLNPLFTDYFERLGLPNVMAKKSYHVLARHVPKDEINPEIKGKLDAIGRVAEAAEARG